MKSTKENKLIAIKILKEILHINPVEISRFTTGYCHSVYYVKTQNKKYVLRITNDANKEYYFGALKWLTEIYKLNITVPKILEHGQYDDVFFMLITYIPGKDLGEVYYQLNDEQKRGIVKELVAAQKKVSHLKSNGYYGYNNFGTWSEFLEDSLDRANERINKNGVFDTGLCRNIYSLIKKHDTYFSNVLPVAFLDDTTTKNVLVCDGGFSGIVDIDEVCYGDPLLVIGLTKMALLIAGEDTKYIDFWLEEIDATLLQNEIVDFYTLLYCVEFMGEQGMTFDNGTVISVNQTKLDCFNKIYNELLQQFL